MVAAQLRPVNAPGYTLRSTGGNLHTALLRTTGNGLRGQVSQQVSVHLSGVVVPRWSYCLYSDLCILSAQNHNPGFRVSSSFICTGTYVVTGSRQQMVLLPAVPLRNLHSGSCSSLISSVLLSLDMSTASQSGSTSRRLILSLLVSPKENLHTFSSVLLKPRASLV